MRRTAGGVGVGWVRSALVVLVAVVIVPALAPSAASGTEPEPEAQDSTVLAVEVQEPDQASVDALVEVVEELAEVHGGEVRVTDDSTFVSVEVPADAARAVKRELRTQPEADGVVRPAEFSLNGRPDDPRWSRQQDYLGAVGLPRAWRRASGSGATIAVVDSGVDTTHPDLRGQVVRGYNAVSGGTSVRDDNGHGTAVASVAAAATNNRRGIAGVAGGSDVLAVKVADRRGRIWGDALAAGIRWAVDNGADVVNLSLGSSRDDPLVRKAVADAVDNGVVVVAAVSNRGVTDLPYPAAYPGVLSVGATDGPRLAGFSDRGADVAAPGVRVVAAVPGGYSRATGTSFAAALVSGQAALIRGKKPRMAAERVTGFIESTARTVGAASSTAERVHLFSSVIRAKGVPTRPRGVTVERDPRSWRVAWKEPAHPGPGGVTQYRIDVRTSSAGWREVQRVDGDTLLATLRGLEDGERYRVRVAPINEQGVGAPRRTAFMRAAR